MKDIYRHGTKMPLNNGYEIYENEFGGDRARPTLSSHGERKRARIAFLEQHGWIVHRRSGVGHCTHPDRPEIATASIAAAAKLQERSA